MTTFATLTRSVAVAGMLAVSTAPAYARSCSSIDADLNSVNRQMVAVAAQYPGSTAGLATCLASAVGVYGNGRDGSGPALIVGGGCVAFVCWMAGSENCINVAGNYFMLGFQRADLEAEARRYACRR